MENRTVIKTEAFLRFVALLLAIAAATVVGTATETKKIFYMEAKAIPKDLTALMVAVIFYSVVAGYNLVQLCKLFSLGWCGRTQVGSSKLLAWVCFSCDQVMAYTTFAITSCAIEASFLAVTGQQEFEWLKLCNKYTRFCLQVGAGLLAALLSTFLMTLLASLSAFTLFTRRSSNKPNHPMHTENTTN